MESVVNHNQESQIQERQSKEVVNSLNISIDECPVPVSTRGKIKVFLWKITGIFCVGLAILGAMLPVLPTTVFLLMATACFAKSSPKLQQKLLNNKTFGPLIHEWQQNRSIPRKAKRVALLMIVFSVVWSSYLLQNALLTLLVIALVIGPFIFLWRLPVSK
jgi:uncharacterized membrane protein YbaN (DUF454 family)|nr:YbaN family protein [Colwellia maritima]